LHHREVEESEIHATILSDLIAPFTHWSCPVLTSNLPVDDVEKMYFTVTGVDDVFDVQGTQGCWMEGPKNNNAIYD
jgi:hypothetical protein